jgi:hypothetical protein
MDDKDSSSLAAAALECSSPAGRQDPGEPRHRPAVLKSAASPARSSAASQLLLVHLISVVERRLRVCSVENAEVEFEHDQAELATASPREAVVSSKRSRARSRFVRCDSQLCRRRP